MNAVIENIQEFIEEEDAVDVVEIILILVENWIILKN